MNWEMLGTIADMAAAIAVVISVIYLAVQIKQSTIASNSSTAVAFSDGSTTISAAMAQDAELNKLFWDFLSGEALPEENARRAHAIIILYLNVMEQAFDLYSSGALSEDKWQGRYMQLKWFVAQPGFPNFWQLYGDLQAPSWRAKVNETMRNA